MATALTITLMAHSAAELRTLAGKMKNGAQVRRVLAIALVLEGRSRTETAEQNGVDRQTLRDWVHRYNSFGIDGLKSRRSAGPSPMLTAAQMAELKALVIQGPDPATHKVVRWRELGRSQRNQARRTGRVVQKLTDRSNQIRCVGAATLTPPQRLPTPRCSQSALNDTLPPQ